MGERSETISDLVTDLYIDGKAVPASDKGRFDVLDPATGTVITTVADGTVDDAIAAIDAAEQAAAAWAATSPRERSEVLPRAFELMTAQSEELAGWSPWRTGRRSPTPGARWRTPRSSSAGTPRRRSAPRGSW
jgi:succinate-semialdehyde dehydrogenase/glutarate-semialdehyde dehydrogenase